MALVCFERDNHWLETVEQLSVLGTLVIGGLLACEGKGRLP